MRLDFNTPVCTHWHHTGMAIPAILRLEHYDGGVTYYCDQHAREVYYLGRTGNWAITRINQHTQPAQERG